MTSTAAVDASRVVFAGPCCAVPGVSGGDVWMGLKGSMFKAHIDRDSAYSDTR